MLICHSRRLSISQPQRFIRSQTPFPCKRPSYIPRFAFHALTRLRSVPKRSFVQAIDTKWKGFGKRVTREKSDNGETESQEIAGESLPGLESGHNQLKWIDALEPLLPQQLRSSTFTDKASTPDINEACKAITKIIVEARKSDVGSDVLAELGLTHNRWPTVLFIAESLISNATQRNRHGNLNQLPSNLNWSPTILLDDVVIEPIDLELATLVSNSPLDQLDSSRGNANTGGVSANYEVILDQIWMSLGSIILAAADMASEQSRKSMSYVYQIIARLHTSDLIPEHIYTHIRSGYDSITHRPPTMHLLSSKILTTLSDAAWYAHREDEIANGTSEDTINRRLDVKPLGDRFRDNDHDLGCEVWLEFVLWCCAEGGLPMAGSWILERIRQQSSESPRYHAGQKADSHDIISTQFLPGSAARRVYHDVLSQGEVSQRSGNTAEWKGHPESQEIVLSLIEASVDAQIPDIQGCSRSQQTTLTTISTLLGFLKPCSLPPQYFDYLTVRLLQPPLLDFESDCMISEHLATRLRSMRESQLASDATSCSPSLELDTILAYSEVLAGIHHQALEGLAVSARVRPAMDMFNEIQRLVDQSKLRSIKSFLQKPQGPEQTPNSLLSQEYTSSHGELPEQKLAAFLDVLTDAELTEVGQWLFYSMDVDGPLIPLNAYSQSSLTPSILRFASLCKDLVLIDDVERTISQKDRKPPVSFLRNITNSRICVRDFENAGHALEALNRAKGGGTSLHNLATMFATLLRTESVIKEVSKQRRKTLLSPLVSLLDAAFHGHLRGVVGNFRKNQIKDHQLGLVGLLRTVEAIPGSVASGIARLWLPRLAQSNIVSLKTRVFDVILSAVVETKGAKVGMLLWDLFCDDVVKDQGLHQGWVKTSDTKLVSTPRGPEFHQVLASFPGSRIWSSNQLLPVRAVRPTSFLPTDSHGSTGEVNEHMSANWEEDHARSTEIIGSEVGTKPTKLEGIAHEVIKPTLPGPTSNSFGSTNQSLPEAPGSSQEHPTHVGMDPPQAAISLQCPPQLCNVVGEESNSSGSVDCGPSILAPPYLPTPVVRPTYRTLGIIIRTAMEEIKAAKVMEYTEDPEVPFNTSEFPAKANMRALESVIGDVEVIERWARPRFEEFGVNEKAVASDFGWRLGETSRIFSIDRLQEKYRAAQTEYEMAKMGLLADISEVKIRRRFLGRSVGQAKERGRRRSLRDMRFFQSRRFVA